LSDNHVGATFVPESSLLPLLPYIGTIPATREDGAPTDVTDAQWAMIVRLVSDDHHLGRPRANQRQTLDGILYVLNHNCAWRKMPRRYGSYVTCWRTLLHWQNNGVWKHIQSILNDTATRQVVSAVDATHA
jgi:transposase